MALKKILVTGASGLLGRNLCQYIDSKGYSVVGLEHRTRVTGKKSVRGDILDLASLRKPLKGIHTVVHCAAKVGGNFRREKYLVNSQGTRNVLEAAINAGVKRFIHISSLAVADEFVDHFDDDEAVNYPVKPRNHYIISKIEAEGSVLAKKEEIAVQILRPGWLWGPDDESILDMFRMIKDGRFRFIGTGNNLTYFTHVNNILQSIELALAVDDVKSGEIFNITDGVKLTMAEFVNTVAMELGKPKVTKHVPVWLANAIALFSERLDPESDLTRQNVAIMSNNLHFSIKKAERLLGYKPDQDLKKQIREIIKSGIS